MSAAHKKNRDELNATIERETRLARRRQRYQLDRERINAKRREEKARLRASETVVKVRKKNDPRGQEPVRCRCGVKVSLLVDGICLECSLKSKSNL